MDSVPNGGSRVIILQRKETAGQLRLDLCGTVMDARDSRSVRVRERERHQTEDARDRIIC